MVRKLQLEQGLPGPMIFTNKSSYLIIGHTNMIVEVIAQWKPVKSQVSSVHKCNFSLQLHHKHSSHILNPRFIVISIFHSGGVMSFDMVG